MTQAARIRCQDAMDDIQRGDYCSAISELRYVLKYGCCNPRAWSKLMLAIRECNRAIALQH